MRCDKFVKLFYIELLRKKKVNRKFEVAKFDETNIRYRKFSFDEVIRRNNIDPMIHGPNRETYLNMRRTYKTKCLLTMVP